MKKQIIYLLVFFLLASFSLAETSLFSDWVYEGQTVSVNENLFYLSFSEGVSDVVLQSDDLFIVVHKGQCTSEKTTKVCFTESAYDSSAKRNKAKVEIYETLPSISLIRVVSKSELYRGEKTNITILITNKGDFSADSILFEDNLDGFTVTDVLGCSLSENKVYWTGELGVNKSKKCTYNIHANDLIEKTSIAKVDYVDTKKRTIYSGGINFKINSLFDVLVESPSIMLIGEVQKFSVNITAKNDSADLSLFRIKIPAGLDVNRTTGSRIKKNGDYYVLTGEIENRTSFDIYLQGKFTGYQEIFYESQYYIGDSFYTDDSKKTIQVKKEDVVLSTDLSQNQELDEGTIKWIKVYLENKNTYSEIKNIKLIVDSPLFDNTPHYFSIMNSSKKKLILSLKKELPLVDEDVTYKFNINYSYQTYSGEKFSKVLENKILVKKLTSLNILKEFSKNTIYSEDEVTITTKIKSTRKSDIANVKVYDDLIPDIGANKVYINVGADSIVTAYSYKLVVPYVTKNTEINITTRLEYLDRNQLKTVKKVFPVIIKPKKLKINVQRTFPQVIKGSIFSTSYELYNDQGEELNEIKLLVKKQSDFGIVNSAYEIKKLSPGEKIKFSLVFKAKNNESTTYLGETIQFKDSKGTVYEQNITDANIVVLPSRDNSPIIYLNKTASNLIKGSIAHIKLVVFNKGLPVQISLIDDNKEWIFYLPKNSMKVISYNKTFSKAKEYILEPAYVNYEYIGRKIFSYSNELKVKISENQKSEKQPIQEKSKEIKTEKSNLTKRTVNESESIQKKEDSKPSMWHNLFKRVTVWFGFLIGK